MFFLTYYLCSSTLIIFLVCMPLSQESGFASAPTTPFKGGETEALKRLELYMADTK